MAIDSGRQNLPLQWVLSPLHVALAWHRLMEEPSRIKPLSQANSTILGKTVREPCRLPFVGKGRVPQSTARFAKIIITKIIIVNAEFKLRLECFLQFL